MPTRFPVPTPAALSDLVASLLGSSVTIEKASPPDEEDFEKALVADFVTENGEVGAAVLADLGGAAALGAALTSMPAAIVEKVRQSGELDDETIIDNFGEIANVLGQAFNTQDTPHVRWRSVHKVPDDVSDEVGALIAEPAGRRDLGLAIEGYGSGRLAILVN